MHKKLSVKDTPSPPPGGPGLLGEKIADAATASAVSAEMRDIAASRAFSGSKRSQEFLQLIVEYALAGRMDSLRERSIGVKMFGRPTDYDTANDAVVRVKANDVRRRLAQYYAERAEPPLVLIELPTGSYTPIFRVKSLPNTESPADQEGIFSPPAPSLIERVIEEEPQTDSARPKNSYALVYVLVLVGLTILLLVAYTLHRRITPIHSIAILPLHNLSRDPDQDYFAEGITGELIAELGQISSLRVISKTSSMTYKGTKKTIPEIARELNVDAVVEGAILREGNKVSITVGLISAQKDQYLWGQDYVRDLKSVLSVQGDLAQSIATEIRARITPEEQNRLKHSHSLIPEAQDQYLMGVYNLNSGEMKKAVDYLQRSVDLDPKYAPAQAALANAYGWLGSAGWLPYAEAFQKQKKAALKAIEIDESFSEGHAELASSLMSLNWDWRTPEHELNRALELNPNSSTAHLAKAYYLAQLGQLPAAISEIDRTVELDPVSGRSLRAAALIYYYARRYDAALIEMQQASAVDSTAAAIALPLGVIYTEKGMYKEAIDLFNHQSENPHILGHLGNAYARSGDVANARKIINTLKGHVEKDGIGRYEIALIYAGLNDKQQAFVWLDEAFGAHDKGILFLKIDPCLDPLRSDPRLQELMKRTEIP